MRRGRFIWILLCLLCGVGAWFLWHHNSRSLAQKQNVAPTTVATRPAPVTPAVGVVNTNPAQISLGDWNTNKFAGRLSNTTRSIGQLVNDRHAILLENALIDTTLPLSFVFPKNLQPQGDPGAYIVQARGPIDSAFRAMLAQAGATVVAYIPNDAYLVRASASVAGLLGANPLTQAVIPYEPYYKIQSPLLPQAVMQMDLPSKNMLNLGLFADDAPATIRQIESLGGQVVGQDQSPFGPVVRVIPPRDWTVLATLPGVQIVEPFHRRAVANDLARATVGVAPDSLTQTNYLGLTGTNVIVEMNDTGIDAQHPDLLAGGFYNRALGVIGDAPSLVDTNGHGTHVAGIIAGDGTESITVTNAPGSSLTNIVNGVFSGSPGQFRGMAPGATLLSVGGIQGGAEATSNFISDQYFQEVPALTNALISNNSWVYEGVNAYDLAAASYDAAVRDALPFVTGSQPVLFVFAAGNAGNGDDTSDFGGGIADSIESPATAKNVITVGALQEDRNIMTTVTNADGTVTNAWQAMTSTSYRVAGFSSRGNVGIGTEGTYGRYKPDVVAPGTFIISTRSEQWDIGTYFYQDPTNNQIELFLDIPVQPGSVWKSVFPSVPPNAVQLVIDYAPSVLSPDEFIYLPIYMGLFPSGAYTFMSTNDPVIIPGDPNAPTLPQILSTEGFLGGFNFGVSNNTAIPITFDLLTDVVTTNGSGTYFLALSNLDNSIGTPNPASTGPGPYYRYESGTSMATPMVSGTLALMQQFYASAYGVMPSPAMLKAMLINGARATDFYNYQAQNTINYEGWGLINLPDSLQPGITNQLNTPCSMFVQDQNPTNALATGDSQTWYVNTTNALPMRFTLAWTDPPGDPAAAIKLVNNLVLVVTNYSNPTNPIVYYGNDIPASHTDNSPHATNTPPNFDSINNVQNVNLLQSAGTNFSVTVMGYRVNVNAVTAQTNNVVQDFALVISAGNGQATNVMTVNPTPTGGATPPPVGSNPTGDQQITYVIGNNQVLLNQFVGANTPLLGTNTVPIGTITVLDTNGVPIPIQGFASNAVVTVGMTNQWHFYVVTNTFAATNSAFTNAAFVTFIPETLSIPRMGVFAGSQANATRPEADIDLYVTTDSSITNLNPAAIAKCVNGGTQVGISVAGAPPTFNGASLSRGGTELVVDIGSQANEVYYIGVKSEDQMASEYGFISIFSETPFSQMQNGNQVVNGLPVPVSIPDGSPAHPGKSYVFGLALYPVTVGTVTVSNNITHQNFGDLIGTLTLNGGNPDVLNNHDSLGNPPGPYSLLYDDSAGGGLIDSRPSDGPGSLIGYIGLTGGPGVWILSEVDDSLTQTGAVNSYTLTIQPHQDLTHGINVDVQPNSFLQVGYVDVPPGATNLTISATNVTPTANPPLQLFVQLNNQPTRTSYGWSNLVNNISPGGQWGSVSIGPPLVSGRYFVGIYNPSSTTESGMVFATIGIPFVPTQTIYNSTDTPIPILDDAVTTDNINVPDDQTISAMDVAISVQHPRISDLVFHLIGPDGTRLLLMENRGATDPNGAGGVATVTTNTPLISTFEGQAGDYSVGSAVGGWNITGNQVSVQTDPANAYPGNTNLLALANGTLSTTLATVPGATYTLTFAYRGPGIAGWWRGEGNALDSVGGNNGTLSPTGSGYAPGEVNQAFRFDGTNGYAQIPNSSALEPTRLGIDAWVWLDPNQPSGVSGEQIAFKHNTSPYAFFEGYSLLKQANPTGDGTDRFQFCVSAGSGLGPQFAINSTTVAQRGVWYHVAATYDGNQAVLYVNGVPEASATPGFALNYDSEPVYIGSTQTRVPYENYFGGKIDEVSIYNRALSASEIQAIHSDGTNGKFDTNQFLVSPRQSLAEAQISVNGSVVNNFFGRIGWVTKTISFTANSTTTSLQIQGIEPGMLLDAASVTAVITNYSYLVFTENTNLTTTPIKFAAPPFLPSTPSTNIAASDFESATPTDYVSPATINDGANVWNVLNNQVSVVADPANADAGSTNFLALANGTVSSTLPTIAGRTYVLTFRYRGPGAVGWWRGESNIVAVDSIYGNNGTLENVTFTNGEVGSAFAFATGTSRSSITDQPTIFGLTNSLSIEGWINPAAIQLSQIFWRGDRRGGFDPYFLQMNGDGTIQFAIDDPANNQVFVKTPTPVDNQWWHVAGTLDGNSGTMSIYTNGALAATLNTPLRPLGALDQTQEPTIGIGNVGTHEGFNLPFVGDIDEISLYARALSASEVKAIYNAGSAGKFDPIEFVSSPSLSLAEAQVTVNGGTPATLLGNNTGWQTETIVFTATQTGTPLQIQGIEPGMLLDSFSLSQSVGDLYYLPEQSLDTFDGLDALGTWTLEIQDDRVGATNPAPSLLSWQLRFNYVTTGTNPNAIPPGTTQTNVIPAGGWAYYPVNVPTNADFATNILVFASGPLDMWFNPTNDPVGTTPPDWELLAASTGASAPPLSLTSSPTNIIPGTTYFIGLHNTNVFAVTGGFQVNFHFLPPVPGLTNGVPITNTIPASITLTGHGFGYYSVMVPTNADYATNRLLFATLPVNLWFNQTNVPVGSNPPDYLLIANATNGVSILSPGTTPPLVPGSTYDLAIQNTNGVPVTIALEVDFHFVSTNPITGPTITSTNNGFLLQWSGPTNYQYTIQWKTNLSPVFLWNTVSNPVINVTYTPTNGDYSWFDDGSLTGGWSPVKFYRVLANYIAAPITNSSPITNIVVSGTITPLTVTVPASAIAATNVLISASGPVDVWFNQTGLPTGNTNAGDVLMLSNVTSGTFVLTSSSVPPLVPGANYYLGVQSLGTSNVSFSFQVNFGYAPPTNPPSISSITVTNVNGTNAILLKWVAPTNYQFQVEWATNLAPAIAWHTISNVVLTWSGVLSPTNAAYGIFQYLDDGSLTGGWGPFKFYRLIEYPYATPIPQTLTIINTAIIGNAVQFQWVAPTNYQYQVLWTTNLGLPLASWTVLANPVLGLSNGVYTFTDTNQTGPATVPKFFRLLEQ